MGAADPYSKLLETIMQLVYMSLHFRQIEESHTYVTRYIHFRS